MKLNLIKTYGEVCKRKESEEYQREREGGVGRTRETGGRLVVERGMEGIRSHQHSVK